LSHNNPPHLPAALSRHCEHAYLNTSNKETAKAVMFRAVSLTVKETQPAGTAYVLYRPVAAAAAAAPAAAATNSSSRNRHQEIIGLVPWQVIHDLQDLQELLQLKISWLCVQHMLVGVRKGPGGSSCLHVQQTERLYRLSSADSKN
jgi:hypothetical protein